MKNVTMPNENYTWKKFVRCIDLFVIFVYLSFLLLPFQDILDQLESLKLENRRLSEMVMKLELGLHEVCK